ncbi:carbon-nitrogen hydrolase family protein [Dyadobacter sp. CY345]|uniref:carbon-nitrogen hydrolase family protein n=1 Tax=Dyadobacter sp. CY345 TaxID=2909335 RepID=UPI001F1BB6C0|nr:carbon-nitrogen hydrolase family protein [Dyadobacter sp. CY345]MCF2446531.1 carbon-nitrogen hydrolase family protein [Dyadobacter sp. CY345]
MMIVAAAQTIPKRKNTTENLEDHYRLVNLAADHGAQLIVFPEMSLTGYEREFAAELSFVGNDMRLDKLKNLASNRNIIILAGAPILLESGLHIGMFVLEPNQPERIYTKQYLHDGEEIAFVPGINRDILINLEGEVISLAICADITNPAHPARAAALNSTLYIASIFYTPNGIQQGFSDLQGYANLFYMSVLMSNFGGMSYSMQAAGQSSFWNNNGKIISGFEGAGEGLLIVEKNDKDWKSTVLETT